jgi:hypothetical protein
MAKGQVLPHEIKKPPPYFYFSNGCYNNPQTHPAFLHFTRNYAWWSDWDFEFFKEKTREVTYLKLTAKLLTPENISVLYAHGFEYYNPTRFNI